MNELISKTIDYMKNKQLGETTGHDWWHTLRVYNMAVEIAAKQTEPVNNTVVALGALLHDIEDWKFNDGDETAGPKAAAIWLKSCGADEETIRHVREIILDLSYKGTKAKSTMKSIEGKIVQDTDRLDAIGAIGIARAFAFGAVYNSEIFNPEILPRMTIGSDEYKNKNAKTCTLNHFYEKLFNLKDLMNTSQAKEIAEKRHKFIVEYVKTLLEESNAIGSEHYKLIKDFQ